MQEPQHPPQAQKQNDYQLPPLDHQVSPIDQKLPSYDGDQKLPPQDEKLQSQDQPLQSHAQHMPPQSSAAHDAEHSLPRRFTVFKTKSAEGTSVTIGEDESHPEMAVTTGGSLKLTRTITLHEGTDPNSPMVASAVNAWALGRKINVSLAAIGGAPALDVTMHGSTTQTNFDFALPLNGPDKPKILFTWSGTSGSTIKQEIGHRTGWKLCTTEGEVVALWSTKYGSSRLSGDFAFVGRGATDEFGEQWAHMAVVTALSLGAFMRTWTTISLGS